MADNRLLGAGAMYYNGQEIGKAYMGNGLVWEKQAGTYMIRCNNIRYSGGYPQSNTTGPQFTCGNNNSFKIQIGLKNYFTTVSSGYSSQTYGWCLRGYISNYNSTYNSPTMINLGNGGLQSVFGSSNGTINKATFGDTNAYLEFEITSSYCKCLTYNKQINFSGQTAAKLQYVTIMPGRSGYLGYCDCSYHYIKIWNGSTLLHDVTAKKINGLPGMYDSVTGTSYDKSNFTSNGNIFTLSEDTSEN